MRVQELTSLAALESLRPEWEALWERCPRAGAFQHPDWLLAWWTHLGGGDLWTAAVWDGPRLAALAPCFIHRDPRDGTRQLTLLGNGVSDQLDVLVADDAATAAALLLDHIEARGEGWHTCDFRDLPPHSPLLARCGGRPGAVLSEDTPCPVLDLAGVDEDLVGAAAAKLLANLRNGWRRAEALGPVRVERATAASLADALDALFALHASRWVARGESGVLAQAAIEAFHREVARRFLRRGWLRLHLLRIADQCVAASYGFHLRGCSCFYIGGFDPRFEKFSPGALVIRHAIAAAIREGARCFDFLRGAETYKYRWGARDRPQFRLQIAASAPVAPVSA